uniref:ATP synthase F0 subunit 8 n=1 Tax=Elateroidea sp. 3 KM-2017 TaxID=2219426 RepID=A0A346RFU7_9COLE|nr:ATP synthase F0 subunit 8 [Elateroidea sp. 3 KM-2017]
MYQMAPLNWTSLFIYFMSIYLIFNTLNFFLITQQPSFKSIKKMNFSTNWKW